MKHMSVLHAVEVIKAALDSQSIKLRGSSMSSTEKEAQDVASTDAAYLLKLFQTLIGEDQ